MYDITDISASSTIARDPKTAEPFSATTGVIRQNTPIGDNLRMSSITTRLTSARLVTTLASGAAFSPARMMPKPKKER